MVENGRSDKKKNTLKNVDGNGRNLSPATLYLCKSILNHKCNNKKNNILTKNL